MGFSLDSAGRNSDGPLMHEAPALAEPQSRVEYPPLPDHDQNHPSNPTSARSAELEGLLFGMLGILAFSFTLPLSRIASPQLGGLFVGIERAVLAAALASVFLLVRREPWPDRRLWRPIALVALGTVLGFGPLSSLAMQYLPAAHGIVVIGLLPAATAAMRLPLRGRR